MNRLRMLREQHGMTQSDLARLLHVKNATVSKYETERSSLTIDIIERLCELFHVTSDYLIGIENTTNDFIRDHKIEISQQLRFFSSSFRNSNNCLKSLVSLFETHEIANTALFGDEKKLLNLYQMLTADQKHALIDMIYDLLNPSKF